MTELAFGIDIDASPDLVFAFASNLCNEMIWNPEARSIRQVTDGPIGVGTHYAARWKGSPELDLTCTAFDPPRSWTHHNDGPLEITSTWHVAPSGSGTKLSGTFDVQPHGIGRLFAPLFVRRMRTQIPANLERIREHCVRDTAATQ